MGNDLRGYNAALSREFQLLCQCLASFDVAGYGWESKLLGSGWNRNPSCSEKGSTARVWNCGVQEQTGRRQPRASKDSQQTNKFRSSGSAKLGVVNEYLTVMLQGWWLRHVQQCLLCLTIPLEKRQDHGGQLGVFTSRWWCSGSRRRVNMQWYQSSWCCFWPTAALD